MMEWSTTISDFQEPEVPHTEAETSKDGVERYLQDMDTRFFEFMKLNEDVDMSKNIFSELMTLQEHFSQLKMDYLFLETKQGLLEAISECADSIPNKTTQEFSALEKSVSDGKKNIHQVKQELGGIKVNIRKAFPLVIRGLDALEQKHTEFLELYDKENYKAHTLKCQTRVGVNNAGLGYGQADDDDLTFESKEKAQRVLSKQDGIIGQLVSAKDAHMRALAELREQLQSLSPMMDALKANITSVEAEAAHSMIDSSTSRQQWYKAVNQALKGMAGVDIEVHHDSIVLSLEEGSARLRVQYDTQQTTMLVITPELQLAAIDISDISNVALEKQDLAFLVREVRARLRCHTKRAAQIEEAMKQNGTRWKLERLNEHAMTVSFPSLSRPVHLSLVVPFDYPEFSSVYVKGAFGDSNVWNDEELVALTDKLNAATYQLDVSQSQQLGGYLGRLESLLDQKD